MGTERLRRASILEIWLSARAEAMNVGSVGPRAWLIPVLTSGLFYLALMSCYLLPFRGDLSALVCLNEIWRDRAPFEAVRAGFTPDGYDGQFYYAIAQNPWKVQDAATLDHPCFRHARLLYPALAWLLSDGDPAALLWALPLLNLIAFMGICWLGCLLAIHFGRGPWWGFLLPVAINAIMPAFRDLTDPLAALAIVGLLASWLMAWPTWLLVGWGVACVLSREQNIAMVLIVGLESLLTRQWRRSVGLAAVAAVWTAWMLTLHRLYGSWPSGPMNVGGPFAGLWQRWTHLRGDAGCLSVPAHALRMSLLTANLAVCVVAAWRGQRITGMIALAGFGLACIAGPAIYADAFSYSRVLNWAPLAVWLWTIQSKRRWPLLVLAPAVCWPLIEIVKVCR
jgi:hypothetical protein